MNKPSRRWQSSKSANTVRARNSSQAVFQKRSILPSVCGCCGRLLVCRMPSRRSSCSNSVSPRHAVYCRPLSVRISSGVPYAAMARRSASSTSTDRWWCATAHPTMNREWSSMNPATYSRWCRRRRNVKMSDCHIWFGRARSNRRGGCSRAPVVGAWSINPASCSSVRTCVSDTPRPSKRASMSRIRRVPYSGCSRRSPTTASRRVSAARSGSSTAAAPGVFGASATGPPC
jgi:hypothetical protein